MCIWEMAIWKTGAEGLLVNNHHLFHGLTFYSDDHEGQLLIFIFFPSQAAAHKF